METQVLDSREQSIGVVGEQADSPVAVAAEQTSHRPGVVCVVDVEQLLSGSVTEGRRASTDRARAVLGREEPLVFADVEPVDLLTMLLAQSVDVACAPGGVLGADFFSISGRALVGSLPSSDSADPALSRSFANRNSVSAFPALGRTGFDVNFDQSVCVESVLSQAAPSLVVAPSDLDISATVAAGGAVQSVDLGQPVLDGTGRMPLEVEDGFPLHPTSRFVVVTSDPSLLAATAMACSPLNDAVR